MAASISTCGRRTSRSVISGSIEAIAAGRAAHHHALSSGAGWTVSSGVEKPCAVVPELPELLAPAPAALPTVVRGPVEIAHGAAVSAACCSPARDVRSSRCVGLLKRLAFPRQAARDRIVGALALAEHAAQHVGHGLGIGIVQAEHARDRRRAAGLVERDRDLARLGDRGGRAADDHRVAAAVGGDARAGAVLAALAEHVLQRLGDVGGVAVLAAAIVAKVAPLPPSSWRAIASTRRTLSA
jgi:hypothetical protein